MLVALAIAFDPGERSCGALFLYIAKGWGRFEGVGEIGVCRSIVRLKCLFHLIVLLVLPRYKLLEQRMTALGSSSDDAIL